eukprot:CAMPEP_0170560476 /NCGR_PEP_ID=MMETSP0211-20121228/49170_1 /TAXON_ID=311385 /ORGANISM="Pseudokeronopsis sp., Strain OXSARD2" /LENGTH=216 /DNA_ID=CAMNT_0010874707 /DNA_START=255 /DNA_END=905 /DNA_ORIENTATION=-
MNGFGPREGRLVLVGGCDDMRVTLLALLVFSGHLHRSFQHLNSLLAVLTLDCPAFLLVEVQNHEALEALHTEVYREPFTLLIFFHLHGDLGLLDSEEAVGLDHQTDQLLHGANAHSEELILLLEHIHDMVEDFAEVSFAFGDEVAALFNVGPDGGEHQFGVDLAVPFDQGQPQGRRHQLPPRLLHHHIAPHNDIVDVAGDRGISSDSMLFHLRDEL